MATVNKHINNLNNQNNNIGLSGGNSNVVHRRKVALRSTGSGKSGACAEKNELNRMVNGGGGRATTTSMSPTSGGGGGASAATGSVRYQLASTATPLYQAAVVDLRHRRAVHSVEHYPCLPDPQRVAVSEQCGAVHYGYCMPVLLDDDGGLTGAAPQVRVDPVRLLSSPELDGSLRSLVDHFVARDKQNQQRRSKPGSPSSPGSPGGNGQANRFPFPVVGPVTTPTSGVSPRSTADRTSPNSPNNNSNIATSGGSSPPQVKTSAIGSQHPLAAAALAKRGPENGSSIVPTETKSSISTPTLAEETLGQLLLDLRAAVSTTNNTGSGSTNEMMSPRAPTPSKTSIEEVERQLRASLSGPTPSPTSTLLARLRGGDLLGSLQSPVDYAKRRFRESNTQGTAGSQRESVTAPLSNGHHHSHMVSETKNRFESGQFQQGENRWRSEWVPPHQQPSSTTVTTDSVSGLQLLSVPDAGGLSLATKRNSPSPEPNVTGGSGAPLPHPKLTSIQKQHIRERALSPPGASAVGSATGGGPPQTMAAALLQLVAADFPVRPFLTKGSVAERVLIFERCPVLDRGANRTHQLHAAKPLFNTWRGPSGGATSVTATATSTSLATTDTGLLLGHNMEGRSLQVLREKENREPSGHLSRSVTPRSHHGHTLSSQQRHSRIPRFHFPTGRPISSNELESHLQRIKESFSHLDNHRATAAQFDVITKACHLPLYWKYPLFLAAGGDNKGFVTSEVFLDYWKRVLTTCHDDATKFVLILSRSNCGYLLPEHFVPLIQDIIDCHPGLTFLKEALEFHSRYIHTVIARIFYCVNRSWSGRITVPELRKSNFLQVMSLLEEEDDINQITEYFSYEHFYVIYCKFWELDKDHDLLIDREDLSRHNDNAISSRMIDRIFSGAVTRGKSQTEGKMTYTEFVWFLLSEEDKRHSTSIEYWFRCMDLDGDGYLSMYELEYFYEEQLQRMEALGIETLPFLDCLCQMLDMVQPHMKEVGKISLGDLKKCKMTPIFFDTFFNLEKYLDHEQKDPFASQREHDADGAESSDWNRYAAEEYELLVAEEGVGDQQDDLVYEDEFEPEDEELASNLTHLTIEGMRGVANKRNNNSVLNRTDDDYADYAESDDYQY